MNVKEAYKIALNESEKKILVDCIDFGESFGFLFSQSKEPFGGGEYITVNKQNGNIKYFSPIQDLKKFNSAIQIDITKII